MSLPKVRWPLAALGCLVWLACTGNDRLAGSGSVTTNGLSGRVLKDGLPASGITVSLYPVAFDPRADSVLPGKLRQVTDRSGTYRFEGLDTGRYNLLAAQASDDFMAIRQGISVLSAQDSTLLAALDLVPSGAIRVRLPEDARAIGAYLHLPGTPIFAVVDSATAIAGELRLKSVPAGEFAALRYTGTAGGRNLLTEPLKVGPEATGTVYPYASWSRAYRVLLDASQMGAGTTEMLAGFPLLVRLDDAHFDFAAADKAGRDLRVTRGDSATPLAFEFESWDPASGSAEVWIRMDSVRAGVADNAICIFAGKAEAGPAPDRGAVFDTAAGFSGVWHLDENPIVGQANMLDRTPNAYHGTAFGTLVSEPSVPGVIGKALVLDGTGDYVQLAGSDRFLPEDGAPISISAWIRPSALAAGDSIRHRLATFKTDTVGISALAIGVGSDGRFSHYTRASDSVFHWPAPAGLDTLYHMGLTFASGQFVGYVDGREAFRVAAPMGRGGPSPALLGAHLPGKLGFAGMIDEFRIERVARPSSWLRLVYETQRPGAPCVGIAPFKP